jgi:DivIVA domain-containing protein
MPLTPADIHNVAFKKPPIGKRGYDEEEVDAFLDEVERELVRLLEDNLALKSHAGSAAGSDHELEQRIRADLTGLRSQLEHLLREKAAAEQAATQIQAELEQAQVSEPARPAESGSQGVRVLMMAQRTADDHVSDARREADDVLADARIAADRTVDEARTKADTIQREARERHQQAVDSLDAKRTDALREINDFAGLAAAYLSRLRDAMNNQLADLEATPPDSGRDGPERLLNAGA